MSIEKKCIKLTDEDRKNLIRVIKGCLRPLTLEISISDDYSNVHSKISLGDEEAEWDEYFYKFEVAADGKNITIDKPVYSKNSIFDAAWMIAWEIFRQLKLDYHGEVGGSLWNKRTEIEERYKDLKWSST